jgi:hypothetical protein
MRKAVLLAVVLMSGGGVAAVAQDSGAGAPTCQAELAWVTEFAATN